MLGRAVRVDWKYFGKKSHDLVPSSTLISAAWLCNECRWLFVDHFPGFKWCYSTSKVATFHPKYFFAWNRIGSAFSSEYQLAVKNAYRRLKGLNQTRIHSVANPISFQPPSVQNQVVGNDSKATARVIQREKCINSLATRQAWTWNAAIVKLLSLKFIKQLRNISLIVTSSTILKCVERKKQTAQHSTHTYSTIH